MDQEGLSPELGAKYSASRTGAQKRNAVINRMLHSQHARNLRTWEFLAHHLTRDDITDKFDRAHVDVIYCGDSKEETVNLAVDYYFSQDDKKFYGVEDYTWVTIIHKPDFILSPFCKIEKICYSIEPKEFGEVLETRPTVEVYDLAGYLSEYFDIRM